jgi:ABC-2 type transport system permease protein
MGLVGGSMMPRVAMPPAMQALGLCVPHGWALDGYHDVIVREGTTLADIAPNVLALLGFGTVFAAIGIVRFRREQA